MIDRRLCELMNKTALFISKEEVGIQEVNAIIESGINLTKNNANRIIKYCRFNFDNIVSGDIYQTYLFINKVYVSLRGTNEGLTEYLDNARNLSDVSYADFRFRLAIMNHFGFLEDVFFRYHTLLSVVYKTLGTKDMYRVLSSRQFDNLEEFMEFAERITLDELKELRKQSVTSLQLKEMDAELMEKLESLKKKNSFLRMMKQRSKK